MSIKIFAFLLIYSAIVLHRASPAQGEYFAKRIAARTAIGIAGEIITS